jgi:hypothetical protein
MRQLFSFPNPVNELAARTVAGGVLLLCIATVVTGSPLLLALLAYGFVARVLTGPTLSPLGQLATRVIAPRLGPARPVPGPPKRFAQGVGTVFTVSAAVAWFGFGAHTFALVLVALMTVPAFLESALGYCVGCKMFAGLMKVGIIPVSVCEACADLSQRYPERYPDPANA